MLKLSKKDIKQGYIGLRKLAEKSVKKRDFQKALSYISNCSSLAGQFNWIFADLKIESLLENISQETIEKYSGEYNTNEDNWVFYDDWCTSYVLAIQWLEALANSGKNVLYITSRDMSKSNRNNDILGRVSFFNNVKVFIVPSGDEIFRAQNIYNAIVDFEASKVVLHKNPVSSPCDLAIYALPKKITQFLINLSDQTYWNGTKAIDYCLEFRNFGASVSLQKRGLNHEQLLMVPFYPADDKNAFAGFPEDFTKDKIIIFSGGDYYKTLNSKRTYWKLVKMILDKYPQVVFLFATKNIPEGDSEILSFISNNHFEGRFIYLQFRSDIFQVFAHSDIFMGTSPTSGSLMTGLACVNSIPILQYYEPGTTDDETEQSICYNEDYSISYTDITSFMKEADRLILDSNYRTIQGSRLRGAIISKCQFEKLVVDTLMSQVSQLRISQIKVDYAELENRWYYLEKAGYTDTLSYLYGLLKIKGCLRYAISIFIKKQIIKIITYFISVRRKILQDGFIN